MLRTTLALVLAVTFGGCVDPGGPTPPYVTYPDSGVEPPYPDPPKVWEDPTANTPGVATYTFESDGHTETHYGVVQVSGRNTNGEIAFSWGYGCVYVLPSSPSGRQNFYNKVWGTPVQCASDGISVTAIELHVTSAGHGWAHVTSSPARVYVEW